MPDLHLGSGSEFDRAKVFLGTWLRSSFGSAHALQRARLQFYSREHLFVAGWQIVVSYQDKSHEFAVLLDERFPFSSIRIAMNAEDKYLVWPHVEPRGLLCLPKVAPPTTSVDEAAAEAIRSAVELIEQCQSNAFRESEFRKEFLSYWGRSCLRDCRKIRSLLDPGNHTPRVISVADTRKYYIVADSDDSIFSWLRNSGVISPFSLQRGLYFHLNCPPTPPFIDSVSGLYFLIHENGDDVIDYLPNLDLDEKAVVVLGGSAGGRDGLVAVSLSAPNQNGFRRGTALKPCFRKTLWRVRSRLTRHTVDRFDAAWVHGRGQTVNLPALIDSNVLILGCGSLGSQVGSRLAQAGVGSITFVDPDLLSASNVGRHALGIGAVGEPKALALANLLRQKYPHSRSIDGRHCTWQQAFAKERPLFESASMIVACMGEWSADGPLGEWHCNGQGLPPVVYGWLGEFGTTSHAVALASSRPCLRCILSSEGRLTEPETLWEGDGGVQSEPACGTLFQPYGPIDVAHADALVSRLCLDVLTSSTTLPVHRVYACPTAQLEAAGGQWSDLHKRNRPAGYSGPFEYERQIVCSDVCPLRNEE